MRSCLQHFKGSATKNNLSMRKYIKYSRHSSYVECNNISTRSLRSFDNLLFKNREIEKIDFMIFDHRSILRLDIDQYYDLIGQQVAFTIF